MSSDIELNKVDRAVESSDDILEIRENDITNINSSDVQISVIKDSNCDLTSKSNLNDETVVNENYKNERHYPKCIQIVVDFFNSLEKVYCPDKALINLKNYKYSSVDKSYVSKYILKPYWEFCTTLFPKSMAPNLITLVGFAFMIINMIFAIIFVPDLEGPTSRWFYFSCALGLWLYSTFDNVDGKQARRTKTSSPLGELFDHGCDSLNCAVGSIVECAALGMGHSYYTYTFTIITILTFYFSTWETYYTGTLYLGYVNGPTEGLILGSLIMLFSGIWGPEMWWKPLSHYIGSWIESILPDTTKLIDVIMVFLIVFSVVTQIPITFFSVQKACKKKGKKYTNALANTLSFVVFICSTYLWVSSPHSVVLSEHMILFILDIGFVFGRIATDIILAHVTGQHFPKFTFLIFPVVLGALLINIPTIFKCGEVLNPTGELIYLWIVFGISVVFYSHWAISVIRRFCRYLDINCLTIKKKPNFNPN